MFGDAAGDLFQILFQNLDFPGYFGFDIIGEVGFILHPQVKKQP